MNPGTEIRDLCLTINFQRHNTTYFRYIVLFLLLANVSVANTSILAIISHKIFPCVSFTPVIMHILVFAGLCLHTLRGFVRLSCLRDCQIGDLPFRIFAIIAVA